MSLRPSAGGVMLAGVLVLAAGATAFGAAARPTDPPPASARTVPVSASVSVCPTAPGQNQAKGTSTILAVGALPEVVLPQGAASAAPADGVRINRVAGSPTVPLPLTDAGTQTTYAVTTNKGITAPTVVRARGELAPGAAATQLTRIPVGPHRALIGQVCPAPTGNAWFVGGSGAVGRLTTVEIDNPDSAAAVADVLVYAEHGQVPAPSGRGIAIPAHGHRTLRVDVLAPETSRVVLNVIMRAGRAAVTVTDTQRGGIHPLGADVVPAGAAPARRVVVPSVPGGTTGSRTLEILAPGDQDALVRVQVIGRDGRFTPDTLATLSVPAGSVRQAQLLSQTGDGSIGLLITSDVPVVAGVRNVMQRPVGPPDVTYSASTRALRVPVAVPGLRSGKGWTTRLMLSAPSSAARVTVTMIADSGATTDSSIDLTGGTHQELVLTGPSSFMAVVTPDLAAGAVYGAVHLSYTNAVGYGATLWPLVGAPLTVTMPTTRTDPALGVPAG